MARIALVVGAVVVTLALVLGTAAYMKLGGGIQTFDAAGLSKDRPDDSGHLDSQNILLIGSDTRSGANSSLGGAGESVGRSDTTLLVHVYADHTRAVAVSIPRDSLVTIPSCRLPDGNWTQPQHNVMFNSAFSVGQTATGNPACTQNTVEALTGLKVDHTIVVDFEGFAALTKAIGGVEVCLPNPVYQGDLDPNLGTSGKMLFPAGRQKVAGVRALQYVRIRHGLGDGSDIGRIRRQQAFLASVVMKIRREGLTAQHLLPLVDAATGSMTFDPSLGSPAKLLAFGLTMRDITPNHMTFLTVPWQYDGPRVRIVQRDARRLWAALRTDQPLDAKPKKGKAGKPKRQAAEGPSIAAKAVPISVYNGTLESGLASRTARRLKQLGFTVGTIGNAPESDHVSSEIRYGAGYEQQARELAKYVSATLKPDDTRGISIVLGQQHGWRGAAAARQPVKLPSSVTGGMRTADVNPCSNLT
jgi:LCP family protein required for cell wall assembly